jgi:phosphomannomutase/phosphoglucomutase
MAWPKVKLLYAEVDGTYPNHEADPTIEKNMEDVKEALQATDAEVGLGFDGDCDRMVPMTKAGKLVTGDKLLALFAQPIVQKNPGTAVVFDVKSSAGLIELLERWGAKPCMSPSGHAIIKNQMKTHNALLGGEMSCHFFFSDRYFGYDDGIYAMLRLFELLLQSGKTLDELLAVFPPKCSTREFRIPCPDSKKNVIVNTLKKAFAARKDAQLITMDGVRVAMPYGWGIVRTSNTQPVLSMRFEADTWDNLQRVQLDFIELLQPYFESNLKKIFKE